MLVKINMTFPRTRSVVVISSGCQSPDQSCWIRWNWNSLAGAAAECADTCWQTESSFKKYPLKEYLQTTVQPRLLYIYQYCRLVILLKISKILKLSLAALGWRHHDIQADFRQPNLFSRQLASSRAAVVQWFEHGFFFLWNIYTL